MKIYTRKGDDGTTGLLFGGRVRKDAPAPVAYGDVDELQAQLGVARAACSRDSPVEADLAQAILSIQRDLWVLMAELATLPEHHDKLGDGTSRVTATMVTQLEGQIDTFTEMFIPPKEFVVPGETALAAALDVGRTVARRAERSALSVAVDGSSVVAYLNRLSDLLWTLARVAEGTARTARSVGTL